MAAVSIVPTIASIEARIVRESHTVTDGIRTSRYRGRIKVAADNDRRLVADRAQEIIHLPPASLRIPSPLQVRDTHRDAPAVDLDAGEHGLMRTDQRVSIKLKRRFGQRDGAKVLERLRTQNRVADSAKLAVSSDTTERWHKHETHL